VGNWGIATPEYGRAGPATHCRKDEAEKETLDMAKGIYERKGKQGDVTYYVRYQSTISLTAWFIGTVFSLRFFVLPK